MLKKFLDEFKAFALKGNVLDLAIGVIIGGAFSNIVTSLLDNVISPIVGCFSYGGINGISVTIWKADLRIGAFLNDCVNFIIMALVVFLLMKGVNTLITLGKKKEEEAPAEPSKEEKLLMEIRDLLTATASPEALAKLEAAKAAKEEEAAAGETAE